MEQEKFKWEQKNRRIAKIGLVITFIGVIAGVDHYSQINMFKGIVE